MLVTLSPKLCAAMQANVAKKTDALQQLQDASTEPHGAAGPSGVGHGGTGAHGSAHARGPQGQGSGPQLLDQEAVDALLGHLPDRLSLVEDKHCPLVLPLRKLLFMIHADAAHHAPHNGAHQLMGGDVRDRDQDGAAAAAGALRLPALAEHHEVTFEVFAALYWPALDEKKRKGLDAAALWTEVQSHIKGSVAALQSDGRLTREAYVALAER